MSIELKDARHELDVLEEFINNPELIMSDLSAYGVSDYDFLFQNITVNGKTFYDAMMEYLKQIEIFNNDDISLFPYLNRNIRVSISSFEKFNNQIMYIDFINHTYQLINDNIKYYNRVINGECVYAPYEVQDIFKRYENYTLKKRLAVAWNNLFNKDKTCRVRILDFFFSLFVSKKYLLNKIDKEYKRVEEANKCLKKRYDEDIKRQEFYKKNAPKQIRKIEQKQKEIVAYLSKYGFKEKT